jgi:hypothetical protein
MEQEPEAPTARLVGLAIVFVVFLVLASLIVYQRDESYADLYAVARAGAGGGYIGSVIGTALGRLLGGPGTIVTLVVVGAAGGVLLSGLSREQVAGWFEREPRPSTGAEPAADSRAIRINPNRQATPNAPRPATTSQRPSPSEQPVLPLGPAVALKPGRGWLGRKTRSRAAAHLPGWMYAPGGLVRATVPPSGCCRVCWSQAPAWT